MFSLKGGSELWPQLLHCKVKTSYQTTNLSQTYPCGMNKLSQVV